LVNEVVSANAPSSTLVSAFSDMSLRVSSQSRGEWGETNSQRLQLAQALQIATLQFGNKIILEHEMCGESAARAFCGKSQLYLGNGAGTLVSLRPLQSTRAPSHVHCVGQSWSIAHSPAPRVVNHSDAASLTIADKS